jgi:2-amino-4-hydroxy-6-hydroxymethyldihydropteridine diphosphokinase
MPRVFFSLGSNLGDRMENLSRAVMQIGEEIGPIQAASQVYETKPCGFESPHLFLNMAVVVKTGLTPEAVMEKAGAIEERNGRTRKAGEVSDRTIDIDLLFYGSLVAERDGLTIPHPRLHERRFVLAPLHDIAPGLIHPVLNRTIGQLLSACEDMCSITVYHIQPPKRDRLYEAL